MGRRKTTGRIDSGLSLTYISPKNDRQARVLRSENNLVLSGLAGTGKTFLASYLGYYGILNGDFDRMIYIRSAVPTRDIGFLPGNAEEKLQVYEAPYMDIATELFGGNGTAYDIMKKKGVTQFTSTSFIRGNNMRNAVVIVDECQNMSYHELDSIITRLHDNCRVIFCGDIRQADLTKNGLGDFFKVIKELDSFDFVEFGESDIVRGELVKSYIIMKDRVLNR